MDTTAFQVREMRHEADGVLGLRLVPVDGARVPAWAAGAHIEVEVNGQLRHYSLCGDVEDVSSLRIAVLKEPAGLGASLWIHETLRPGDILDVRAVRNRFELAAASHYLFIAGGIGITPILAMVAEAGRRGVPWALLYGGRELASMAFLDDLEAESSVTIWPQDERGHLDLVEAIGSAPPGAAVYCCGPPGLIEAVGLACATRDDLDFHFERFVAAEKPATTDDVDGGSSDQEVIVTCARSGTVVEVAAGTPILDALEAAGVPVASQCREGYCGTCETRVIAGTPDHRDDLLSDDERAAGESMMICVSRALGDRRLTLDC